MSIKRVQKKPKLIRLPEGYGPILRPTARETYSLRQQIFELVRATGRIARAKIARTLDISPGSVTALTAELISDGFLREVEETSRETSRGRPPVALELVPDALYVIGVKLSDELHTATLTDFGGNALASASQITTADKKSADELLTETEAIISKVCKSAKISQKKNFSYRCWDFWNCKLRDWGCCLVPIT